MQQRGRDAFRSRPASVPESLQAGVQRGQSCAHLKLSRKDSGGCVIERARIERARTYSNFSSWAKKLERNDFGLKALEPCRVHRRGRRRQAALSGTVGLKGYRALYIPVSRAAAYPRLQRGPNDENRLTASVFVASEPEASLGNHFPLTFMIAGRIGGRVS
jgi:hypothetical protein